ncbi:MAG: YgaP-like transmembrane domain [Trueperaceae bacterium]
MAGSGSRVNLGPVERGVSLALGALAGTAAFRRRTPLSALLVAAGSYLVYRGVSGRCRLYRALGITGSEVGSTVSACSQITVQRPAEQVYQQLRDLTNFPRFSRFLEGAEKMGAEKVGDERWRLQLRTPLGNEIELDVRQTADEENRRLAWCTVEGAPMPGALEMHLFEGKTGTEIHADAWLVPQSGTLVPSALRTADRSKLLRRAGLSPSEFLEQELRRLRQLLETGETATVKGQSAGGRRARSTLEERQAQAAGGAGR